MISAPSASSVRRAASTTTKERPRKGSVHAGPVLFRSGWFVESLTTQTLVIFVIRTRRVPFYKSRPSRPLLATTLACAAFGVAIPYIPPLAHLFGFRPLPLTFLAILTVMIVTYLALAQIGVGLFFKPQGGQPLARAISAAERSISRRASRWSSWRHRTPPKPPLRRPAGCRSSLWRLPSAPLWPRKR